MSGTNNNLQSSDPTFDPRGNAAVGEFYSSGGKNDSTGREPFEDTSRDFIGGGDRHATTGGHHSSGLTGGDYSSGGGIGGATSRTGNTGIGGATGGFEAGRNTGDDFGSSRTGGLTGGDSYGSDRAARDYDSRTGEHEHHSHSGTHTGTHTGTGEYRTGDNRGEDRSAGYDRSQGGPGNQGISEYQGREHSGPVSGGAAGTDRFDVDRESSGAYGEGTYGKDTGDKTQVNQNITRTGRDFTGGATASGGAYTDDFAKTGLTGRETTTTGVNDQHGQSTAATGTHDQEHHKQGLMEKVKNVIGGHKGE
jgi:hypothetical protein